MTQDEKLRSLIARLHNSVLTISPGSDYHDQYLVCVYSFILIYIATTTIMLLSILMGNLPSIQSYLVKYRITKRGQIKTHYIKLIMLMVQREVINTSK